MDQHSVILMHIDILIHSYGDTMEQQFKAIPRGIIWYRVQFPKRFILVTSRIEGQYLNIITLMMLHLENARHWKRWSTRCWENQELPYSCDEMIT